MSEINQSHVTVLDSYCADGGDPNRVRYVKVGDKIFAFTPETCFKDFFGGADYYPYYDDDLTTVSREYAYNYFDNLCEHVWGDGQ